MPEKFPEPNSLDFMERVPVESVKQKDFESKEQFIINELTPDKWEKYKMLRLRSAETEPQSWGKSIQAEPVKDEAYWRGKLEEPNFKMFSIEIDGRAVAMAGLQQKPDGKFFLRRVYSLPEMRGKGLATTLIKKVFEEAIANGAKSLYLGVTEGIPAVNLYKSFGFTELSKQEKIRGDGKPHNEILMEKKFD